MSATGVRLPEAVRTGPLLAALFLVGFNLRATMASVPPLLRQIETTLGIGGFAAGLLTSLPVLCMGLLAPLAHRLAQRIGRGAAITGALATLSLGLLLRLGGASAALLYGGTLLAGAGIAVVGTVLPGVVKEHFPGRAGMATAAYGSAMALGATVAAGISVPVADAFGAWQPALAVWALPALAALVCWAAVGLRGNERAPSTPAGLRLPWRSRTAWLLSAYLAVQSALFYSSLTWVAPSYVARGWSPVAAGVLLSVFMATQVLSTLAPAAADRFPDRRPLFLLAAGCGLASLAALVFAPGLLPYGLVAVLGFGQGAAFALGLVLLVDYAPDPQDSGRLSAMAFLLSYATAAFGPAAIGALRDATGGFRTPFMVLLALNLVQLGLATRLSPDRRI